MRERNRTLADLTEAAAMGAHGKDLARFIDKLRNG